MRPARLAARVLALLGPVAGPVAVVAPRAGRLAAALAAQTACASDSAPPAAGIVSFLGAPARPADRQAALRLLARRLPAGAPLVLVDHNQPRVLWRRGLGILALAVARCAPSRARYPAARELAALGFAVERLRLACGERVQLVLARSSDPRPCLGSGTDGENAAP
ncbi:MAG: hypothetical protein E6J60_00065 [Deltaproteobacteria bacterium]|nr:MAG: hypothetical protein E6J60_00065 [Deltaproteobacteria bacterium]